MSWSLIQHDQILWKLDNSSHCTPHHTLILTTFQSKIKFCLLSSSPSRPVMSCTLPVLYPSPTCPLPVPYPSGLPKPNKGTGTDTIFDFRPPTTTNTTKLFRSLDSPLGILYLSLTPSTPPPNLPLLYPLVPYPSHTCPLPLHYRARLYRNSSCLYQKPTCCSWFGDADFSQESEVDLSNKK